MTDPIIIVQKLSRLREQLERLKRRSTVTIEEFKSDVDLQDATAMSLLVAVQEALDIGLHIASEERWGVPGSYREAFDLLASHDVIDLQLAERLKGCVAVRNRIAHGYATIDVARFHGDLPAGIDALESFASSIARMLPAM